MKSQKYLEILKETKYLFTIIRLKTRIIEENNNGYISVFNEFACSTLSVRVKKVDIKRIDLTNLKQYLITCLLEHVISEDHCQKSTLPFKFNQIIDKRIDNLLNNCDAWINTCEKLIYEEPLVCVNCGQRLSLWTFKRHECRNLTSMSHMCSCGELFDNHFLYYNHIKPIENTDFLSKGSFLSFPNCKWAGLHWLLTWLDVSLESFTACGYSRMGCNSCKKTYTNFITWFTDYRECMEKDMLRCQICSDVMGGLITNDIPKLKCSFIANRYLKMSQINLHYLTSYFINFRYNKNVSIDELMTLMGFGQIFSYELNHYLQGCSNPIKSKQMELSFFKHRSLQLLKFFSDFPKVCLKCYERLRLNNEHSLEKESQSKPNHKCKGLKKDEHVCVCTARFSNHESYIFHRLYKCQFLLYVHISLLMVSNNINNIYSLCNKTCTQLYCISSLRSHWKACEKCHSAMIKSCIFCSYDYKEKSKEQNRFGYYQNLIKSKNIVKNSENMTWNFIAKQCQNYPCEEINEVKTSYFYNTKLYCLKSGPPFNLVGFSEKINSYNKRKKLNN